MTINIPTLVSQTITNGVTAYAPSENVVFDALALKADTTALAGYQPLDADLTSIAGLTGSSSYLRKTSGTTYQLDSYTTVANNMPSTSITAKILTGFTASSGFISPTDTILSAFETIDSFDLPNALGIGSSTMAAGSIICGSAGNVASIQSFSLSVTGGTFGLSGTGELTMPNAATGTRGLLTSTDWNTFNGKQTALVSGTNIKTINGSSILGSGDLVISGGGITIGTSTITSGTATRILYNNGGVVGEYTLTGSGTAVAMGTSPTFTTDITTPKIIGGTAVGSIVDIVGTSGNGTSTVAAINFKVGNNGGTDAARVYNSGNFNIGNKNNTTPRILRVGQDSSWLDFGSHPSDANYSAMYMNATTPGNGNYTLISNNTNTYLNASTTLLLAVNDSSKATITSTLITLGNQVCDAIVINPKVLTGGNVTPFTYTAPASTLGTAGAENVQLNFDLSRTRQFASNTAITTQREFLIKAPTYSFQTATGTITTAGTLVIDNAPIAGTNAAITNPYALWVQAGKSKFGGNVELTQTVTTEVVVSDTTVTVVINGTTYKLLAKA